MLENTVKPSRHEAEKEKYEESNKN